MASAKDRALEFVKTQVLTGAFPGGELMFDIYSRLVVRMIEWMPAARATDVHMTWPIDDARDLVRAVPRLELVDEVPFLTLPELAEHLPRNDALKAADDSGADSTIARVAFDETRWARWNGLRVVTSTVAVGLLAVALTRT